MRRTENFPKSFTRSANCGCLREKEQEENETQKNDRNCSFFYHLLHTRGRGQESFEPADFPARHLLFRKQERRR